MLERREQSLKVLLPLTQVRNIDTADGEYIE